MCRGTAAVTVTPDPEPATRQPWKPVPAVALAVGNEARAQRGQGSERRPPAPALTEKPAKNDGVVQRAGLPGEEARTGGRAAGTPRSPFT